VEEVLATLAGGGEQRREDGRDVGAELRAVATDYLAVDDGRVQILLGGVIGRRDVRTVEEDEQAGAMLAIGCLEAAGVGRVPLFREEVRKMSRSAAFSIRRRRRVNEAGVSVSRLACWWMARPSRWLSSIA